MDAYIRWEQMPPSMSLATLASEKEESLIERWSWEGGVFSSLWMIALRSAADGVAMLRSSANASG